MSGRIDRLVGERVFIGLGGNLGDPRKAMAQSIRYLHENPQIEVVRVSSLYRTPPWGKSDQPDFLNAVAELRCKISPRKLLELCLTIERDLKRERTERWGPRLIDIDIIAFGDRGISEPGLEIPHPRLGERAFVLVPLAEIAPDLHIGTVSVVELLSTLDRSGIQVEFAGGGWCDLPDRISD